MTKHASRANTAALPADDPSLRQRAALSRDAAGRFIRRDVASTRKETSQDEPPVGYLTRPQGAHPDCYGLVVDEGGAGARMPPGSTVVVEPVPPSGRDFCVVTFVNGRGPSIWQIGSSFEPDFLRVAEGSEVTPMIEVFEPSDGRRGYFDLHRIETLHRVHSIHTPVEVMNRFGAAPADLPLLSEVPEGFLEHVVVNATNYPVLRQGDIALIDITKTQLTHGALTLLSWCNGSCSILQTNFRTIGSSGPNWFVDPLNRPQGPGMMERRQKRGGLLYASDGPYAPDDLDSKIVGTVVGILSRRRSGRTRSAAAATIEG